MNISKGLLSEVLGKHAYIKNDIIWIPIDEYEGCELEPNTFTEIKIIVSFKYGDKENKTQWIAECNEYRFRADTEPEAIFKACEWIREDKDK